MRPVAMVRHSTSDACGIAIFSRHLRERLQRRGICVEDYDLAHRCYEPASVTLVHYVPSMWADATKEFREVMADAYAVGQVLVLLHGMYGPGDLRHGHEKPCKELPEHLSVMQHYASAVIALSSSCASSYSRWRSQGIDVSDTSVLTHPGVYSPYDPSAPRPHTKYVFYGGVIRPKKSVLADSTQQLFQLLSDRGLLLWSHQTNASSGVDPVSAWRTTFGLCSDAKWTKILGNAAAVICPYGTRIQTVSGVIAEAISVGTPVASTDFAFAREMQRQYPDFIRIEDDLSKWPGIVVDLCAQFRARPPDYPTWDRFVDGLIWQLWAVS